MARQLSGLASGGTQRTPAAAASQYDTIGTAPIPRPNFPSMRVPDSWSGAQTQYRQILLDRAALGDIVGAKETKKASALDAGLAALKQAFPGLDLTRDYNVPIEAVSTEKPATLAEIQALANSIPIPSLGAQGSSAPGLTSDPLVPVTDNRKLIGWSLAGVGVVVALFLFLRK
jgi:hypothetical protein